MKVNDGIERLRKENRRRLRVFASSSDWFIGLTVSVVIGQSDYFDFGFTIHN